MSFKNRVGEVWELPYEMIGFIVSSDEQPSGATHHTLHLVSTGDNREVIVGNVWVEHTRRWEDVPRRRRLA